MPRIILQYPFMKHYAGSVFDLEVNTRRAGWDLDERLYERLPSQNNYFLPDGGKGFSLDLPVSDTILCPPSVFESVDLTTGPCRVTSAHVKFIDGNVAPSNWQLNIEQIELIYEKQGIKVNRHLPQPKTLYIRNRQNDEILKEIKNPDDAFSLDFKDFMPGFYEIIIECSNDLKYQITFIKCFPLVVTYDAKSWTYTTMKTIY